MSTRVGGTWMVTASSGANDEIINSFETEKDAVIRAEELAERSTDYSVKMYKAVAFFSTSVTPVKRTDLP